MHALFTVSALLSVALAATGRKHGTLRSETEPCALISQALARNFTKLDADVAYKCLKSVPLDVKGAGMQLEGIQTMVQFQSK